MFVLRSSLFILIVLLTGCASLEFETTVYKSPEVNMDNYKVVAIMGVQERSNNRYNAFTPGMNGQVNPLLLQSGYYQQLNNTNSFTSSYISDLLVESLIKTKRFSVFDKDRLDVILQEQMTAISAPDLYSAKGAAKIGELSQVDAVIFGKITEKSIDANVERTNDALTVSKSIVSMGLATVGAGHGSTQSGFLWTHTAKVGITLHVTDVATGNILAKKNIVETVKRVNKTYNSGSCQ